MLLDNLSDLFQRGLEYAWDCEHLLVKHLAKMVESATSKDLEQAFDKHLVESKNHVYRLEKIFARLDRAPAGETNEPIKIIVAECEKFIGHLDKSPLLDAALIFSGNQIEHYEIALYGSLRAFAQTLGLDDIAMLIDETLSEEKAADEALSTLAEASINRAARTVHNAPPFALI